MVTQWRFPSFSAKTLSVVAWAVASLGHTPSQEWLVLYEQQVRGKGGEGDGGACEAGLGGGTQRGAGVCAHGVRWCMCRCACACACMAQVREKFWEFSGQELACIAWALRRFGAAPEHNAVFYMLQRQVRGGAQGLGGGKGRATRAKRATRVLLLLLLLSFIIAGDLSRGGL